MPAKRSLTLAVVALSIVGLIVNVAVDLDNEYDMTLAALWFLTFLVALISLALSGAKDSSKPSGSEAQTQKA